MRQILLTVLVLVCFTGPAFAQAGGITVNTTADLSSCEFVDAGGLVQVFIAHIATPGATASQFMLTKPAAWVHLGDTWNFSTVIGTSVTGVSVAYGACLTSPIVLGMVNFFGAAVPPCTQFGIVADPAAPSGLIEGVDCALPAEKTHPGGSHGVINNDGSCPCDFSPVEDSTWGGVKALYR